MYDDIVLDIFHRASGRNLAMKRLVFFGALTVFLGLGIAAVAFDLSTVTGLAQAVQTKTMPEVIILAKDARLGQVTFNHVKHNGGTYSIDATGKIACIACHHTAQPAADLAAHPPLKTAWPADRTTVLTGELFAKDPAAAGVAACRDCHSKVNTKPKLIAEIPVVKHEASPALITLTNQSAFHRACDGCHVEVSTNNPAAKVPKATQCTSCHKRVVE